MNRDAADQVIEGLKPAEGSVSEVAKLFLKLGTIAFGGPAALIAMMHDEISRRRRWVSEERFLDLRGADNMIPGTISTDVDIESESELSPQNISVSAYVHMSIVH